MGGEELREDGETETGERSAGEGGRQDGTSHNERAGEQESWSRSLCTMACTSSSRLCYGSCRLLS